MEPQVLLPLTQGEVKTLEKLAEYMEENEERHYAEYVEEGGKPSTHIYHQVKKLRTILKRLG